MCPSIRQHSLHGNINSSGGLPALLYESHPCHSRSPCRPPPAAQLPEDRTPPSSSPRHFCKVPGIRIQLKKERRKRSKWLIKTTEGRYLLPPLPPLVPPDVTSPGRRVIFRTAQNTTSCRLPWRRAGSGLDHHHDVKMAVKPVKRIFCFPVHIRVSFMLCYGQLSVQQHYV